MNTLKKMPEFLYFCLTLATIKELIIMPGTPLQAMNVSDKS